MKYHIKNKISKREIRKQGKNILPLELMHNDKFNGFKLDQRRDDKDKDDSEYIQMPTYDGDRC